MMELETSHVGVFVFGRNQKEHIERVSPTQMLKGLKVLFNFGKIDVSECEYPSL